MYKNESTSKFHQSINYLSSLDILKTKFDLHKNRSFTYWKYALLSIYISKFLKFYFKIEYYLTTLKNKLHHT
jgi:hypothetical protein